MVGVPAPNARRRAIRYKSSPKTAPGFPLLSLTRNARAYCWPKLLTKPGVLHRIEFGDVGRLGIEYSVMCFVQSIPALQGQEFS
jgi:hypothetical protein